MSFRVNRLSTVTTDRASCLDYFFYVRDEGLNLGSGHPEADCVRLFNFFVNQLISDKNDAVGAVAISHFHTPNPEKGLDRLAQP